MRLQGFLYTLAAACVFGLGAVLIKLIAGFLDPLLMACLALLIGGFLIVLFIVGRRQSFSLILSRSAWIDILLLSSLGTAFPLILVIVGLLRTSPVTGGFMLQLQGPVGIILACLFLREKLTWKQGTGTILLIIGSMIIILAGTQTISWQTNIQGDLLILIGALGFGYSLIPAKRLSQQIDSLQINAFRLLLGAFFIIPLLFFQSPLIKGPFSWYAFWLFLLYSFSNFCLGYIMLQEGLSRLPAWASAAILQTISIFTTAFAIILLQDTLSFIQIIGGIIAIAGGIIVVSGDAFPKRFPGISSKNRPGHLANTL